MTIRYEICIFKDAQIKFWPLGGRKKGLQRSLTEFTANMFYTRGPRQSNTISHLDSDSTGELKSDVHSRPFQRKKSGFHSLDAVTLWCLEHRGNHLTTIINYFSLTCRKHIEKSYSKIKMSVQVVEV